LNRSRRPPIAGANSTILPRPLLGASSRHAKQNIARFIAYSASLPNTPGNVAKMIRIQGVADLRKDSFERIEGKSL
jgi:hypothetical protein